MYDIEKAAKICHQVAADRKRWGKHGGFNMYSDQDVLDALVTIDECGLFDSLGEKDARIAANRARGAAEAREKKYKKQLDEALEQLKTLKSEHKKLLSQT